ncbi:acyl-CoA dehydrogenase family protein [Bacillus cereus]|uniref:acyl-CoA dehydrogenase family protein n=1 Tax=Bacillus cereus TaxID=1396 RepID=UPI001374D451|nr:acyl-CoA dehydrogenase family protein [Bacillus cereus]
MNFSFSKEQIDFKKSLDDLLGSNETRQLLSEIKKNSSDTDPRKLYKLLGENGYLAPNFPSEYGGLDKTIVEAALVIESMSDNGIPESLHVLSTFLVGNLLLEVATEKQKKKYLTEMARGEKTAIILYSEPKYGSDLGSLESTAILNEEGEYVLNGRKVYSVKSNIADYGLFAARTSNNISKYDGISLFMVPIQNNKNIHINEIPTLSDESLYEVCLENVKVSKEDIIGEVDEGWIIINKALSYERTGLDYYVRAKRWFLNIWSNEMVNEGFMSETKLIELARLKCKLEASKNLTYQVIEQVSNTGSIDELLASISKLYSSQLASDIVAKGHDLAGIKASIHKNHDYSPLYGSLDSAYRESPGLTISAGTTEMMLENISKFKLNIK